MELLVVLGPFSWMIFLNENLAAILVASQVQFKIARANYQSFSRLFDCNFDATVA